MTVVSRKVSWASLRLGSRVCTASRIGRWPGEASAIVAALLLFAIALDPSFGGSYFPAHLGLDGSCGWPGIEISLAKVRHGPAKMLTG